MHDSDGLRLAAKLVVVADCSENNLNQFGLAEFEVIAGLVGGPGDRAGGGLGHNSESVVLLDPLF